MEKQSVVKNEWCPPMGDGKYKNWNANYHDEWKRRYERNWILLGKQDEFTGYGREYFPIQSGMKIAWLLSLTEEDWLRVTEDDVYKV